MKRHSAHTLRSARPTSEGIAMLPRTLCPLAYALIASCLVALFVSRSHAQTPQVDPGLTAHEWGTFTSIADNEGQAVEWLPLTGSTDLPGFVEHFRNASFKRGLSGTVRMETPVLYFHAAHETTVSVKVAFSRGLITEWYPRANRLEPNQRLTDVSLHQVQTDGSIAWDSVTISPDHGASFPREEGDNPYYAARATSASPLLVKTSAGAQREKFLFYRGVSVFPVPISAKLTPSAAVQITDLLKQEIPNIILFERRGEKIGYRVFNSLQKETNLDPPELNSTIDSLAGELQQMLASQGLYQDEARAMVETWRHSWFEEGSRLLYLVPRPFVDAVLPLSIRPTPAQTVRVFVGRLELVTPATQKAVQQAFASHDRATQQKYGRFLEPILDVMIAKESDPAKAAQLRGYLQSVYNSLVAQLR